MKKNRMMRLASILLVCVLLTTSVISGTFAKYTTTVTALDKAHVAKWGFTGENADINITDLFVNVYAMDANPAFATNSVVATTDVIAPGTEKSATFFFDYNNTNGTNAPEVAYTLDVNVDETLIAESIKENTSITWAVYKTGETPAYGTWDDMVKKIEGLDGNQYGVANCVPNSVPAALVKDGEPVVYTIAWKWDFEGNDEADTAMGNADNLAEVTVKITIKAEQVD